MYYNLQPHVIHIKFRFFICTFIVREGLNFIMLVNFFGIPLCSLIVLYLLFHLPIKIWLRRTQLKSLVKLIQLVTPMLSSHLLQFIAKKETHCYILHTLLMSFSLLFSQVFFEGVNLFLRYF